MHSMAAGIVWFARAAILFAGLHWMLLSDWLSAGVAAAAWLLSFPATVLADRMLRHVAASIVSVLLAARVVLGMYVGLYESSQIYDKVMHLIGSAAVGVILIAALHACTSVQSAQMSLSLRLTLVFAGTLSIGTLWEMFEFAVDLTGLFAAQRGLRDTMLDLTADAAGAGLVVLVLAATRRWNPTPFRQFYSLIKTG